LAREKLIRGGLNEGRFTSDRLSVRFYRRKFGLYTCKRGINGIGYVDEKDHIKNIVELRELGVEII
jgi:biotin synthase-like enzyme